MPNDIEFIHFPELGLTGPVEVRRWAAVALFSSDLTTSQIEAEPRALIRPLVRAIVMTVTEQERADQVAHEYQADPETAEARMAACSAAVPDADRWPLMADWKVAR